LKNKRNLVSKIVGLGIYLELQQEFSDFLKDKRNLVSKIVGLGIYLELQQEFSVF